MPHNLESIEKKLINIYENPINYLFGEINLGGYVDEIACNDILIGGKSLYVYLKSFFDIRCKTYLDENNKPFKSFAINYFIYPKCFEFMEELLCNNGFEDYYKNNDNLFEFLKDYENSIIILIL